MYRNSFSYDVSIGIDFSGNSSLLEDLVLVNGRIDTFLMGLNKGIDTQKLRAHALQSSSFYVFIFVLFLKQENLDVEFMISELRRLNDCKKSLPSNCAQYTLVGCVKLTGLASIFPRTR